MPEALADRAKGMADRELGPMSQLPIEWLEQLLSFVSTVDLHHGCLAVNKEWQFATQFILKTRKSLKIVDR